MPANDPPRDETPFGIHGHDVAGVARPDEAAYALPRAVAELNPRVVPKAFQRVRYVHVLSSQADTRQQLLEQLSGLPDERDALLVLVEAGCLAHEHQIGARATRAEDDLGAALREAAARAAADLVAEREQLGTHAGESTTRAEWSASRCQQQPPEPPNDGWLSAPTEANTENCLRTFAEPQSGQSAFRPIGVKSQDVV